MTLRSLMCLVIFLATPAVAQERPTFGLEIGTTRWKAIAHSGSGSELIPDQPTMVTARFTTRIGRVGLGLSVARAARIGFKSPSGPGFNITGDDQAAIWELSPEARVALLPAGRRTQLFVHAGLIFDKWHIKNFENRNRGGLIGGVTGRIGVGQGTAIDLRWDYVHTGTPFDPNEAGTGVTTDDVRRSRLGVGIVWKL